MPNQPRYALRLDRLSDRLCVLRCMCMHVCHVRACACHLCACVRERVRARTCAHPRLCVLVLYYPLDWLNDLFLVHTRAHHTACPASVVNPQPRPLPRLLAQTQPTTMPLHRRERQAATSSRGYPRDLSTMSSPCRRSARAAPSMPSVLWSTPRTHPPPTTKLASCRTNRHRTRWTRLN